MADGYFKTRWKRALRSTGKLWSELTGKDDQPGDEIISQLQNLKSRIANAGTKEQLEKLLREYRELSANVELPGDLALESVESLAKNIQNHIENRDAGLISQAVMEERIREAVLKHALANIDQEFKKFEELHKLEEEHQEFFIRVIENRNKILQATQPLPDNAETHAIAEEMGMAHNFWKQMVNESEQALRMIERERTVLQSLPSSEAIVIRYNDQVKTKEALWTERKQRAEKEIALNKESVKKLPPNAQIVFEKEKNAEMSCTAILAKAKHRQETAESRAIESKAQAIESKAQAIESKAQANKAESLAKKEDEVISELALRKRKIAQRLTKNYENTSSANLSPSSTSSLAAKTDLEHNR